MADAAPPAADHDGSPSPPAPPGAGAPHAADELALLQRICAPLADDCSVCTLYQRICEAAERLVRSDFASLQMLRREAGGGEALQLLANCGFSEHAQRFWEWVVSGAGTSCGTALKNAARVVIPDIEASAELAGTEDQRMYLATGIRAVQSTPLVSRAGTVLGMLSTHWRVPHVPSEREHRLLDILARLAADLIERKLREEKLAESEARFRVLVESASQAVWETDAAGLVVSDSPSWRACTGQSLEEWLGTGWLDAVHPDDRADAERRWREAVQTRRPLDAELRLRRAAGGHSWTRVHAAPLLDADGRVLKWVGMNTDISARKRAEEGLQASEQQLVSMFSDSSAGMAQADVATRRFVRVNEALCRVTGYSEAELLAMTVDELNHPDDREADQALFDQLVAGADRYETEKRYVRKDGGVTWVRVMGNVARNDEGRPVRAFAVIHDIAERRSAEEALRASERRLQAAMDIETVGVLFFTLDGRITGANRAFERMSGYSLRELLATAHWRTLTGLEHLGATAKVAEELATVGRTAPYEKELVRPDGSRWWGLFSPTRLAGAGASAECVEFIVDITPRKRVETALAEKMQALRDMDRNKDEFIATLAHELRNPLAPIRQAVRIAGSPAATPEQVRWSHEVIDRQARQMAVLLDDLLDVARISRGRIELHRSVVDLREIVRNAVEIAHPLIEARRHVLRLALPEAPLWLDADPVRIAQVIANLLTNAARYTDPRGTLAVAVRAEGDRVVLTVADNGVGIAPEHLESIFRMFSQLRAPGRPGNGGLGVGLALARQLAELHGGTLTAHSAGPGRGATFTLALPAADVRPAAPPLRPAREPDRAHRILVVDDNTDAADSLAIILQDEGHQVETAYDAAAAMAAAQRLRPDVALLDLGMPDVDGFELARRLRRIEGGEHIRLVAVTGWGQPEDRRRTAAAGFSAHLTKPVDPDALAGILADEARRAAGSPPAS